MHIWQNAPTSGTGDTYAIRNIRIRKGTGHVSKYSNFLRRTSDEPIIYVFRHNLNDIAPLVSVRYSYDPLDVNTITNDWTSMFDNESFTLADVGYQGTSSTVDGVQVMTRDHNKYFSQNHVALRFPDGEDPSAASRLYQVTIIGGGS